MDVAYLTADQLDQHGPEACTPGRAPRGYTVNDDGSNPFLCAYSRRRIDPATGVCGYHECTSLRRLPGIYPRYDGVLIIAHVPAHPYPLLQEAPPS